MPVQTYIAKLCKDSNLEKIFENFDKLSNIRETKNHKTLMGFILHKRWSLSVVL